MTHEGGGWTLFAHHSDGIATISKKDLADKTNFGVLANDKWLALRDNMTTGMMFIDEHGRVSIVSATKLDSGNCTSVKEVKDLLQNDSRIKSGASGIWHHENSGCTATGRDYSIVQLKGRRYNFYETAGAALYQESLMKFIKWPYASKNFSYDEQNTLLYLIK